MKKIIALLLLVITAFSLLSCQSGAKYDFSPLNAHITAYGKSESVMDSTQTREIMNVERIRIFENESDTENEYVYIDRTKNQPNRQKYELSFQKDYIDTKTEQVVSFSFVWYFDCDGGKLYTHTLADVSYYSLPYTPDNYHKVKSFSVYNMEIEKGRFDHASYKEIPLIGGADADLGIYNRYEDYFNSLLHFGVEKIQQYFEEHSLPDIFVLKNLLNSK